MSSRPITLKWASGKLYGDPVAHHSDVPSKFRCTFGFFYCHPRHDPHKSTIIYRFVAWGALAEHIVANYRKGSVIVIEEAWPHHGTIKCPNCNKWHSGAIEWQVKKLADQFEGVAPPDDEEDGFGALRQEVVLDDDLPY
jgi:hypothetical protein